jgi:hypothetical protein
MAVRWRWGVVCVVLVLANVSTTTRIPFGTRRVASDGEATALAARSVGWAVASETVVRRGSVDLARTVVTAVQGSAVSEPSFVVSFEGGLIIADTGHHCIQRLPPASGGGDGYGERTGEIEASATQASLHDPTSFHLSQIAKFSFFHFHSIGTRREDNRMQCHALLHLS